MGWKLGKKAGAEGNGLKGHVRRPRKIQLVSQSGSIGSQTPEKGCVVRMQVLGQGLTKCASQEELLLSRPRKLSLRAADAHSRV